MITVALARRLRDAGVRWTPSRGDRFVVDNGRMDREVFVLSDMTVEVYDLPTGKIFAFNGTTEWALDSVEEHEALWLPRESQLRDLLGGTFASLSRDGDHWVVRFRSGRTDMDARHPDPEQAYGLALYALVTGEQPDALAESLAGDMDRAAISD